MAREKTGRRGLPKCLTCLIASLVTLIVFVVIIIIGANIAFNKYVSPHIGGVTLSECNQLLRGMYRAKRDDIVTDEYTQQDLDDFYLALNSKLYQKEMTEEDWQKGYNELTEEQKAATTYEEYCRTHKYRVTVSSIMDAMKLDELLGNKENEEEAAAAAAESEEASENELAGLFKQLSFDFSSLATYPYTSEDEDPSYTTFQITGKQTAAFIGALFPEILNKIDLSSTPLKDVKLTNYIAVPQILTYYTKAQSEEGYEKSVRLDVTVEFFLKELISEAVAPMLQEAGMPSVLVSFLNTILPKKIFFTMGCMPLDENGEATVKINNYNEKQQESLKKIINALTSGGGFSFFGGSGEESEESESTESKTLFQTVNDYVRETFTKINDYVPMSFVSDEHGSATLRLAHIQAMLTMMGIYDVNDLENSVSPHMFLTTLRCLFDASSSGELEGKAESLDTFYDQLAANYGINREFWDDHSLLDTDTMQSMSSQIDMSSIAFRDNADMKVFLRQGQFAGLLSEAIANGTFFKEEEPAAAAESETDIMKMLTFEAFTVKLLEEGSVTDFEYTDEDSVVHNLASGSYKTYALSATVSLSVTDLLGMGNSEGSSKDIIDALSSALPEKLTLKVNLKVKDILTETGEEFHRFVGGQAGETSFAVNNFNETYTDKVMNVLQLMMKRLGGSDDFGTQKLTETLDEGFGKVFTEIKKNFYCSIDFSEKDEKGQSVGCLVLPSVYEIVSGFATAKIESSEDLHEEDNVSVEELKALFADLYNIKIAVLDAGEPDPSDAEDYDKIMRKYSEGAGDVFLQDFSTKYYLMETISANKIFGEGGLDNLVSMDGINFKGYQQDETYIPGLYTDTGKTLAQLIVPMSGDELCSLINSSNSLDSIDTGEDGILSSLTIITCSYQWKEGNKLYLNIEFTAKTSDKSLEEEDASFNTSSFIPETLYITASILLYAPEYTEEAPRFKSTLLINTGSTSSIEKLVKIFSGGSFNSSEITDAVSNSMRDVFKNIEDSVNLIFSSEIDGVLAIDTVFNTINKISNKDNPSYVASAADDLALKTEIQEFGRQPSYTRNGKNTINTINTVTHFTDNVNIYDASEDSAAFFEDLNENFYITDEANKLNSSSIKTLSTVESNFVDFDAIYRDTTPYNELKCALTNVQFTALANEFLDGALIINYEDSTTHSDVQMGEATIIQSRIKPNAVELVIYFETKFDEHSDAAENAKMLPNYFFITTVTDLNNEYETTVYINNFSSTDETVDLFARINLLTAAIGASLDIKLSDISDTIKNNMRDIFENYLVMFGNIEVVNGQINLPNFFEYLVEGKLDTDSVTGESFYNKEITMKEANGEDTTDPETLRYRIQELGKQNGLFVSNVDKRMMVWKNGVPDTTLSDHTYYNANRTYSGADTEFYNDMQAYYFLKTAITKDTFTSGNTSLLASLDGGDLGDYFNLNVNGSITLDGTLATAYKHYGLFHYAGEQAQLRLSDKALAAIINEQGAVTTAGLTDIESITITSLTLKITNANVMDIEISMKITTSAGTDFMPAFFYLTSKTHRDMTLDSDHQYATTITLNRFTAADFENFQANLSHLSTFDLSGKLNTDEIADKINEALKDFFDQKVDDYTESFGTFTDPSLGVGYIQFKNIYDVIVDYAYKPDRNTKPIPANAATMMQHILVQLNTVDTDGLLVNVNPGTVNPGGVKSSYTDKEVAYSIDSSSGLNVAQCVIFKGTNTKYTAIENVLKQTISNDFEFATDEAYILFSIDINVSGVSGDVKFLPDNNIYGTVLFDKDSNVVGMFFNKMTTQEASFFMDLVTDDGSLDIESTLTSALNTFKGIFTWSYAQNTDPDFTDYYGRIYH